MTDLNFDYAAARAAGYSDADILDGLQQHGKLSFDLTAARKSGYDDGEILQTLIGGTRRAAEPQKEEESTSLLRRAGDVGLSALKGVISVPEAIVGLADIPTGGAAGRAAEALGVKFKESKELLSEQYSDAQKGANQRVADAKGFVGTAGAMLSNPSTLVQTGVESLPSMVAGGAIGRGVMALAPRVGAVAAGAIGEGAVGAGQAAEQIRQQTADGSLSAGQAGAALASGVGTGIFGLVGGRIAQKMGISDIDTALVQVGAKTTSKGVVRRMIEGGISEGVFEELPQSVQEQMWQNVAMDRPIMEGVPEQAAQGMLAGGLFGGVAGAALPGRAPAPQTAPEQQPGPTPLLTNNPEPLISFPDGSVGRQSDVDGFLSGLPEDARAAARARLYGYEPQPVTPEDVLRAQSVDEAIAVAERAIAEDAPAAKAQKNAEIDAAWQQYLASTSAQREQEFTAAEQARREADVPLMQEQVADQVVAQAGALTEAQGFDEQQPTAMQLAMQEARAKRQAALDGAAQRRVAAAPEIDNATLPTTPDPDGAADVADPAAGAAAASAVPTTAPAVAPAVVDGGSAAPAVASDRPAAAAVTEQRAREILNAAGVTGNERLAALRAVRTGENTLEDLIDAHPPKETENATPPTIANPVSARPAAGAATPAPLQQDPAPARADTAQLDEGAGDVGARAAVGSGLPAGTRVPDGDAARGAAGSADGLSGNQPQSIAPAGDAPLASRAGRAPASPADFADLGDGFTVDGRTLARDGERVGDLNLDVVPATGREPAHVAVRDIRTAMKGSGTGAAAMRAIMARAEELGLQVALSTEAGMGKAHQQRLRAFYERLGFRKNTGADKVPGIRDEYVWTPGDSAARASASADTVTPASGMSAADVTKAITRLRAKWLGFTRVEVVQSVEDLLVDLRERAGADESTEGLYDPRTKTVHLIADNISSAERAAWVAAHEVVGHGGLRMLQDKSVNEALNLAGANRFVKELANAIQQDRTDVSGSIAIEEAVAELAAAIETDNLQALTDRYRVQVPASAQNGIRGVVARVLDAVRRFLAQIMGQPVADVSDADVRALIGEQQAVVEGRQKVPDLAPDSAPAMASSIPANQRTIEVDGERRPIEYSDGTPIAEDFDGQVKFWQEFKGDLDSRGRPIREDAAPRASRAAAAPAPQNPAGEERIPKWAADLPPEQQAALRKSGAIYTEKTAKQKVKELFDGAAKKLQYGILDQFAPIKDQLGQVPYMHARLAKAADGTLEAMMLYGRPHLDADGAMLVDTTKKGFVETMQQLDGEHDRFFSWLAGRRAEQLKKEGRENLFTDDDISALAKLNQGTMKDGRSREAAYLRAQKDVAELNKSVLDIAETSGLIDAESRKVWSSDFYVPFYRVMEEGITGPSVKSGLVNQKSIKKLKGGTNNLGDLTQNMLMNWSTLLTASAKNRAAKASLDVASKMGVASEAPESTIKAMAKSAQTRAVSYMEDGTNRWFVVEDDHLLAAISALEFSGYNNQAMKVMGTFKNWLTRAITISPYFKVRNLIRDSLSVIAVSDANYNVLKNWKDGASLLRNKDEMAQMVAGGGIFRFGTNMEGNRGENVKRLIDEGVPDDTILNTAQKMAKFTRKLYASYEKVGDLSENLNRAALYKQLRESGKSHLEASFEARDLMDFGLSGAWAGVRALNQILPFFNARLQGMYKLGRGYNDDPKRMAYVIGAMALATIALSAAFKDDDDFKKRSDSDRANYWWFKVGGIAYRIPKPFEVGAAATAIDQLFALWYDSENTDSQRFAHQMGELVNGQLAMNPIPQVFRPLIDVYANKDAFSGRPIESLAMQRLRPEDRYSSNTSELARLLGKSGMLVDPVSLVAGTGVKPLSPVQIDSLIKGYFAGVGVFAVSAVDGLLHHTVIDRGAALPVPLRTLTGSFVEELPTNSSRYVDMLYKTAQDVEQTYASYQNAIKQGDIEKARQIMKDEGGTLAKYHMIESLKRNESRIGQAITRIRDSRELTGEQKEEQIRRLKLVQDQIARRMVTGK
jgi:GNAT superfamily N-acetyltransferase